MRTFLLFLLLMPCFAFATACVPEAEEEPLVIVTFDASASDDANTLTVPDAATADAGGGEPDVGFGVDTSGTDASTVDAGNPPPTKEEASATAGSWPTDYCSDLEWYGDGTCDDFCPRADSDCFGDDVLLARDYARALNIAYESSCRIHGIMKNDEDGVFHWGGLYLYDGPPESCEIVAEEGACFVRECEDLEPAEIEVSADFEAGVGFTTNQSRWSSNPYWSYGSANTFSMPARGGDIEIGWKYDGARESVIVPAPSVVSEVEIGEPALGEDLWVDLTYQRSASEESAPSSTTLVRVKGSGAEYSQHLTRSVECLVPDTVDSVRVDSALLDTIGLEPGFWMRVEAGGWVMRFADVGGCQGSAVVAKRPSGRDSFVGERIQLP